MLINVVIAVLLEKMVDDEVWGDGSLSAAESESRKAACCVRSTSQAKSRRQGVPRVKTTFVKTPRLVSLICHGRKASATVSEAETENRFHVSLQSHFPAPACADHASLVHQRIEV